MCNSVGRLLIKLNVLLNLTVRIKHQPGQLKIEQAVGGRILWLSSTSTLVKMSKSRGDSRGMIWFKISVNLIVITALKC